jgi:hypothetical protein
MLMRVEAETMRYSEAVCCLDYTLAELTKLVKEAVGEKPQKTIEAQYHYEREKMHKAHVCRIYSAIQRDWRMLAREAHAAVSKKAFELFGDEYGYNIEEQHKQARIALREEANESYARINNVVNEHWREQGH